MTRARVAATACALTVLLVPAVVRAQIVPWPAQTVAPDSGSAAWQRFHAFHEPVTNDVVTPPPVPPVQPVPPPSASPRPAPPAPTPAPAAPLRTSAPRMHAQRPLTVPVRTPAPAPVAAARPTPAVTPRPQPAVASRPVVHAIHFGDVTPQRSPPVWYGWGTL